MKSLLSLYNEVITEAKQRRSVGMFVMAKDTGNFLLLHRVNKPVVWSVLSGKMDKKKEQPYDTLRREIKEEIGMKASDFDEIYYVGSFMSKKTEFNLFIGFLEKEIDLPNLKTDENDKYGWFNENNIPSPIHDRWSQTYGLIKDFLSKYDESK